MVNPSQHSIDTESGRAEVADAIKAWRALRNAQWNNRGQRPVLENILKILRFMGLQCDSRSVQADSTRSTTQISPAGRHFTVNSEQEGTVQLKGLPQFGSDAKGVYHIVCAWNHRPHTVTSLNWVTSNARGGGSALIVIYLDGLTKSERNEIRGNCVRDDLSFALLDEILFEYLATVDRYSRFETFIRCALAYSAPNPYIPEENLGAYVPPEIFYGRERIARSIERGSMHILFGGRQVGKTALLRHIERRGNDREGRRFTWFIDLKDEGFSPGSPDKNTEVVWKVLLRLFKEEGLIGENPADVRLEDMQRLLRRTFYQDPRLRVLVLLDESDRFLELDTASGSPVVESMRVLMVDTNNRFNVVFAGLHSVQKHANRPNTPLANFGFDSNSPRRGGLGPLRYDEAQRFVTEPMHTVGIEFENPLLVDTILTFTECHAAEIQFFCHSLVALFRKNGQLENPPYTIRQNHVDEVADSEVIRRGIRRRYDLTFRLDERYRAISLSMVHYYHGADTSSLTPLSVSDVRNLVREQIVNEQLWDAFDENNLSNSELEALLNELIGLGILAQQNTGYRIRSQRIARVFGSRDDVTNEISRMNDSR